MVVVNFPPPLHASVSFLTVVSLYEVHVRFNNYDRAPRLAKGFPPMKVPEFYDHWKLLLDVVQDPALTVELFLQPGSLIAVDNWRTLHGRTGFEDGSGRALAGCYIGHQEAEVRREHLAKTFDPRVL